MAKRKSIKNRLVQLIKKYGKVRIICSSSHGYSLEFRKRILYKNGNCRVAYKGAGYTKYSEYNSSCFVPYNIYYKEPMGLIDTIEEMIDHDKEWCKLEEIQYGKYYRIRKKL
jgi:ribosomal protein L36